MRKPPRSIARTDRSAARIIDLSPSRPPGEARVPSCLEEGSDWDELKCPPSPRTGVHHVSGLNTPLRLRRETEKIWVMTSSYGSGSGGGLLQIGEHRKTIARLSTTRSRKAAENSL